MSNLKEKYGIQEVTGSNTAQKWLHVKCLGWEWIQKDDGNVDIEAFVARIKSDIKRYLTEGITPEQLDAIEGRHIKET